MENSQRLHMKIKQNFAALIVLSVKKGEQKSGYIDQYLFIGCMTFQWNIFLYKISQFVSSENVDIYWVNLVDVI